MRIINQLKEKVFNKNCFIHRLVDNHNFLACHFQTLDNFNYVYPFFQARPGKNYESIFLSVLSQEVHQRIPTYRVLLSVDMIFKEQSETSLPDFSGLSVDEVKRVVCNPAWFVCHREIKEEQRVPSFHSTKCFRGRKWITEIDAAISNDSEELCFIEYEEKIGSLCNNFMKMHRLKRTAPNRQFGSLFVTRVSDRKRDSTLNQLDDYMAKVSPLLDTLLREWSVLALVNLFGSRTRRRLKWYPS